jgi:hypothetical protein
MPPNARRLRRSLKASVSSTGGPAPDEAPAALDEFAQPPREPSTESRASRGYLHKRCSDRVDTDHVQPLHDKRSQVLRRSGCSVA